MPPRRIRKLASMEKILSGDTEPSLSLRSKVVTNYDTILDSEARAWVSDTICRGLSARGIPRADQRSVSRIIKTIDASKIGPKLPSDDHDPEVAKRVVEEHERQLHKRSTTLYAKARLNGTTSGADVKEEAETSIDGMISELRMKQKSRRNVEKGVLPQPGRLYYKKPVVYALERGCRDKAREVRAREWGPEVQSPSPPRPQTAKNTVKKVRQPQSMSRPKTAKTPARPSKANDVSPQAVEWIQSGAFAPLQARKGMVTPTTKKIHIGLQDESNGSQPIAHGLPVQGWTPVVSSNELSQVYPSQMPALKHSFGHRWTSTGNVSPRLTSTDVVVAEPSVNPFQAHSSPMRNVHDVNPAARCVATGGPAGYKREAYQYERARLASPPQSMGQPPVSPEQLHMLEEDVMSNSRQFPSSRPVESYTAKVYDNDSFIKNENKPTSKTSSKKLPSASGDIEKWGS